MKLDLHTTVINDANVEVTRNTWVAQSEDFPIAAEGNTAPHAARAMRDALKNYLNKAEA